MNKYSNELINNFPEYLFNEINQKKIAARHSGKDIIDLGYGNPDLPTHDKVVEKLIETAKLKKNHKYSVSKGIFGLREAIAIKYEKISATKHIVSDSINLPLNNSLIFILKIQLSPKSPLKTILETHLPYLYKKGLSKPKRIFSFSISS